jgi:hypothetical protein
VLTKAKENGKVLTDSAEVATRKSAQIDVISYRNGAGGGGKRQTVLARRKQSLVIRSPGAKS